LNSDVNFGIQTALFINAIKLLF